MTLEAFAVVMGAVACAALGWMANAFAFERWLKGKAERDEIIRVGGKNYHLREEQ